MRTQRSTVESTAAASRGMLRMLRELLLGGFTVARSTKSLIVCLLWRVSVDGCCHRTTPHPPIVILQVPPDELAQQQIRISTVKSTERGAAVVVVVVVGDNCV